MRCFTRPSPTLASPASEFFAPPASVEGEKHSSPPRPVTTSSRPLIETYSLMRSQVSAAAAVLAEAERDLDLDLRILHSGRDFRLVVKFIAHAASNEPLRPNRGIRV